MKTISEHLGERLKFLRQQKHLTVADVAAAAGMTTRSYIIYESGQSNPVFKNLYALAEYFNVSLDYLAGRTFNTQVNR